MQLLLQIAISNVPQGLGGGLRGIGSRRHTGPTWCPAVRAIAGRTRPLVTDFPLQLGLEQTPPGPSPAAARPGAPEGGGVQWHKAARAEG